MSGKVVAWGSVGLLGLALANAVVPVTDRKRQIKNYLGDYHLKQVQVTGRGSFNDCASNIFNYPIKTRFAATAEGGKPVTGVVCRAWGIKPRVEIY